MKHIWVYLLNQPIIFFSETFSLGLFLIFRTLSIRYCWQHQKNNLLERIEITSNASTISNRGSLQSNLQPLTVYHGYCITCEIGFVSTDKRNIKRGNFWELTVLCRFKVVEAWEKVDHEYNEINQLVEWQDSKEIKWAHKACKGTFFKKEFLASQMQFVRTNQLLKEKDHQNNESVYETKKDKDTLSKSV